MSLVSRCVKQFQSKCSFSIDHILNVAGEKNKLDVSCDIDEDKKFEWLNCTRYKPPKLQRKPKREVTPRRRPARNPRIPFSSSQVAFLEAKFLRTPYLSSSEVTQLAANLHLSETRVKIWFQNRRARERRDRETKSKIPQTQKEPASQSSRIEGYCGLENILIDRCFHSEPLDRSKQLKIHSVNIYNSVRDTDLNDSSNYVQIFTPLDLSERHFPCK